MNIIKNSQNIAKTLTAILLIVVFACNKNKFKRGEDGKEIFTPAFDQAALTCGSSTESKIDKDVKGAAKSTIKLDGEFCTDIAPGNAAGEELTVLFVIDESLSMIENDPGNFQCGRSEGVNTIYQHLSNTLNQTTNNQTLAAIRFGIITFSSNARIELPLTDLRQSTRTLSPSSVCGHEKATNYQAAFSLATEQLRNITGKKVIYFISDGLPSKTSDGVTLEINEFNVEKANIIKSVSKQAADNLRSTQNLDLRIIFLKSPNAPIFPYEQVLGDPKAYLTTLTGSPDKVTLLANGSQIAENLIKVTPEQNVTISPNAPVEGSIKANNLGTRDIKDIRLIPDSNRARIWKFTTGAIELYGKPGETIINEITIKVKDSDNKWHAATAVVRFSQTGK